MTALKSSWIQLASNFFFLISLILTFWAINRNFEYIERKGSEKLDIMASHTLKDYPKELQKKVTLLTHFRSYLEGEGKQANPAEQEETDKKPNSIPFRLIQ